MLMNQDTYSQPTPDILHIEASNFIDKPLGGQLTFSRQLMKALGSRLALVGWATSSEPVGCWFNKVIDDNTYRYFAIGRDRPSANKPLVPARLTTWFQIKRYSARILSIGIPNILVEEHSVLMAINLEPWSNLCYCFPGVDAPLSVSRYSWAKHFTVLFDHLFYRSLALKANCILAAADDSAIADLKHRAGDRLINKSIIPFPTRVDTNVFHPGDRCATRKKLNLPTDAIMVVTTGRIHWAKGWEFLLESFRIFLELFPESIFVFIGDGAERGILDQKVSALGLRKNVVIAGYQPSATIAEYLQAANIFVMGSVQEGWSTSLIEALACHIPIVTTRFSSANTIVQHGVNGFVVERDEVTFANAMKTALNLEEVATYADSVIDSYALDNLANDLLRVWPISQQS
jgi:glycosyltransferase involved in cell wall biosynthesis